MLGHLQHRRLSLRLHNTAVRNDHLYTSSSRQRVCTAGALSTMHGAGTYDRGVSPGLGAPSQSADGRPHKEVLRVQHRASAAARATTGATPLPIRTVGPASPSPSLPKGSGLTRQLRQLLLRFPVDGVKVVVGSAAASDFTDSPGDGWATALAYRQHVERVVARLREDPDAEVQVAEVGKHGRRLHAWAPGDDSVRPSVLAAIRGALGLGQPTTPGHHRKQLGLSRKPTLQMVKKIQATTVIVGSAPGGDFPDSPGDGWATALAYRQHVERVVARLREDPDAEVQVAEVGKRGRRLHAWAPGDESVRPSVLAAIRGALGLGPRQGRRKVDIDLPVGSGLTRTPAKGLSLTMTVEGQQVRVGSTAAGDFPDSPGDGWATALAYRQHVEQVVARLREDPDAQVQVATVGAYGRRLRPWAPGEESIRPGVLAAIQGALTRTLGRRTVGADLPAGSGLARTTGPGLYMHKFIVARAVNVGSVAGGDFPNSPEDGWATALAYRQHVERVVARLREDPDAEVQVAEVDDRGWRRRAWAPGDESVRPSVLAAIRGALGLGPQRTPGRRRTNPDLPEGSGLCRKPGLVLDKSIRRRTVMLGSAAAGDFPDSPGDGWATALAYRQHVERVVARLREDPDAEVQVAEVGKRGWRVHAWAPGDDSVRPSVLAAIRDALLK